MANEHSFLGTGWSFPPRFDPVTSNVIMVSEEQDISESLRILLSTRPGERVMLPRFGCNLDIMLFEPVTTTLLAYVKELILTAILYFEPRIELQSISISTARINEGVVLIELDYIVLSTNSRFNLVYPFYISEGNG